MDIIAIISVSAAALVSVLGQLQSCCHGSKCTHIGCCRILECDRAVDVTEPTSTTDAT
jgi:hypothetical protein